MKNLQKIISRFNKINVLVIGDLILDEYIFGSVERISPEAPVPVVWAKRKTFVPGGAANVAHNIRALDGRVSLVGVAGKDKYSEELTASLKKNKIDCQGIFLEPKRCTTVKTRIVGGHQQIVRLDWEHVEPFSSALNRKIVEFVEKHIKRFDAVIIEDYGKGVINMELLESVIALAHTYKKVITVDPKEEHFQHYRGVTSITPNRKELENAVRNLKLKDTTNSFKLDSYRLSSDAEIDTAALQIVSYLGLESLLVTLGEHGMRLFEANGKKTHIPTVAQEVFDVSGAGDTVIATFTLGLTSGAGKLEAAHIANVAGGIVVGKMGTAVTSRRELSETIKRLKDRISCT